MIEKHFISNFLAMQAFFGKKLSTEVVAIYWKYFEKISEQDFQNMVENIMENFIPTAQCPFPLIAHFLAAGGLAGESRAQSAITAVKKAAECFGAYKTVDFGDAALHAVINRFGGWPEVCSWGNRGEWRYFEKNFLIAYKSAIDAREVAGPVAGLFELGNQGKDDNSWTKKQKDFAKKHSAAVCFNWRGSDFSLQIETKKTAKKEIPFVNNLVNKIGVEK